ncbi:MAG: hypothetical protein AAGG51_07140 [Cyanobacteria bacterium P01_G01_bin.54]
MTAAKLKIFDSELAFVALCFLIGLGGFGYILSTLPGIVNDDPGICVTGGWKYALVTTHAITFALIPLAMRIFYEGLKNLGTGRKSIFASQLGLSFVMVSIASEMGWHVTQCWYYRNDFTMLNFMFYFFLISSFALWADGLVEKSTVVTRVVNLVLALGLLGAAVLYKLGYEADNSNYKVPIYILLTLVFTVLTYRGYKLLDKDWRIFLVPVFSVGVNLAFIFLLDGVVEKSTPEHPMIIMNALYHICHDLLGTEAGVAIFTWLVYDKAVRAPSATLEAKAS